MSGHIRRRGKSSWRLKFDLDSDATGKRQTRYVTVRGKRQDAESELTRLLGAAHAGTLVEPSRITIADYLRKWLDKPHGLAGKTVERYRQLAEQQIIPHRGSVPFQRLKPVHVEDWHRLLLASGGKDGAPLSTRTVRHAHRLLHKALARAVKAELIARNVASAITPPKVDEREIEILKANQIAPVLAALDGHPLQPIAVLALATGMRRGELLALCWGVPSISTRRRCGLSDHWSRPRAG
jgi:integrase